jgi:hypothetical protein
LIECEANISVQLIITALVLHASSIKFLQNIDKSFIWNLAIMTYLLALLENRKDSYFEDRIVTGYGRNHFILQAKPKESASLVTQLIKTGEL